MKKVVAFVAVASAALSAFGDVAYLSSVTPSDWLPLDGNTTWTYGGSTWNGTSVSGLRYEQSLSGQALYYGSGAPYMATKGVSPALTVENGVTDTVAFSLRGTTADRKIIMQVCYNGTTSGRGMVIASGGADAIRFSYFTYVSPKGYIEFDPVPVREANTHFHAILWKITNDRKKHIIYVDGMKVAEYSSEYVFMDDSAKRCIQIFATVGGIVAGPGYATGHNTGVALDDFRCYPRNDFPANEIAWHATTYRPFKADETFSTIANATGSNPASWPWFQDFAFTVGNASVDVGTNVVAHGVSVTADTAFSGSGTLQTLSFDVAAGATATMNASFASPAWIFRKTGAGTLALGAGQTDVFPSVVSGTLDLGGKTLKANNPWLFAADCDGARIANGTLDMDGCAYDADATMGTSMTLENVTWENMANLTLRSGTLTGDGLVIRPAANAVISAPGATFVSSGSGITIDTSNGPVYLDATIQGATNYVGSTYCVYDMNGNPIYQPAAVHQPTDVTWSGAGADGTWSLAGNWQGGVAPLMGDTVIFPVAGGATTILDYSVALDKVVQTASAGPFVHTGAEALTIRSAITNLSASAQDFQLPISLRQITPSPFTVHVGDAAGVTAITNAPDVAATEFTKTGAGTLILDDAAVSGLTNIHVAAGTLKIGEPSGRVFAMSAGGELRIENGARLDMNSAEGSVGLSGNEPTHGKRIFVAGQGPDGSGALYNSSTNNDASCHFGEIVLTGDAKTGGGSFALRPLTGSALATDATSLTGDYVLTVANSGLFNIHTCTFDTKRIDVAGTMQLERAQTGTVTEGINWLEGSFVRFFGATIPETIPLSIGSGVTASFQALSVASTLAAPITLGPGATLYATNNNVNLTLDGPVTIGVGAALVRTAGNNSIFFNGAIQNDGAIQLKNGAQGVVIDGATLSGGRYESEAGCGTIHFGPGINSPSSAITINAGGEVVFGKNGTTAGLPKLGRIDCEAAGPISFRIGASDVANEIYDAVVSAGGAAGKNLNIQCNGASAWLTLTNVTWDVHNLQIGAASFHGRLRLANGSRVTVRNVVNCTTSGSAFPTELEICEGALLEHSNASAASFRGAYNSGNIGRTHRVAVNGGTFICTNSTPVVAVNGPYGEMLLKSGTITAKGVILRSTLNNGPSYPAHGELFAQSGGVFEIGVSGFYNAAGCQRWHVPNVDLSNGVMRPYDSFANTYGRVNATFGSDPRGGAYAIELNGKTVRWNTPLAGASDVTISGDGRFSSRSDLQSLPLGKWTITNTTQTVELLGASGFAGGLSLGPDVQAAVSIGTTSTVEFAVFKPGNGGFASVAAAQAYSNNYPFVASSFERLNASVIDGVYFCYRGQFYVSPDRADRTWYFAGHYDDTIVLDIDGENVFVNPNFDTQVCGSRVLSGGWHDFRVIAYDGSGGQGPNRGAWGSTGKAVGWTLDASAEGSTDANKYNAFDTTTLPMRICPREEGGVYVSGLRVQTGINDDPTWNSPDALYTNSDFVVSTAAMFNDRSSNKYGTMSQKSARFTGFFLVPEDNAGAWAFTAKNDDRLSLRIDGVQYLATTAHTDQKSATANLTAGWHELEIRVYDGSGGWGGTLTDDNGVNCALKVKAAGSDKTLAFNEVNFRLVATVQELAKDHQAGLDGEILLAQGSTLSNAATGACPILGTLKGTGTLSGPFAFAGDANCWEVADAVATSTTLPAATFASATAETFAGLKSVKVTFDARPKRSTYYLTGVVSGLAAGDVSAATVTATYGEDNPASFTLTVKNGRLAIGNSKPAGITIIVR